MKARLFALATLVAVTACGGGHTNATTQQQTTTRTVGAPGSTSHNRSMNGTAGRGASGSMAGSRNGGAAGNQPQEYSTEAAATSHCRGDEVVWLNVKTGVYHSKGTEYYGNTKNGAYTCKKDADAAGDRASKSN